MAYAEGIRLKKKFGQHFLRDVKIPQHMIKAVALDESSSVLEIGCGDGFLTRALLQTVCARVWVFEIDDEWANYVRNTCKDSRLEIFHANFLDAQPDRFIPY